MKQITDDQKIKDLVKFKKAFLKLCAKHPNVRMYGDRNGDVVASVPVYPHQPGRTDMVLTDGGKAVTQ